MDDKKISQEAIDKLMAEKEKLEAKLKVVADKLRKIMREYDRKVMASFKSEEYG